jgi:hypothetical protein
MKKNKNKQAKRPSGFSRTAHLIFSGINVVCGKNSANDDRIRVNSSIGVIGELQ